MQSQKVILLSVTWVIFSCIGITLNQRNGYQKKNHVPYQPNRRFYLYNVASLLPQAAAALTMLAQPTYYKPPPHYAYVQDDEDDEEYEHKKPTPVQFLTLLQSQKPTKIKKIKGNKVIQKIKKCLPFKFSILKRNDIERRGQESSEITLITVNTTGLFSNRSRLPEIMNFVYPGYTMASPPLRQNYMNGKLKSNRKPARSRPQYTKWSQWYPWEFAPQGKVVSEFPLQEPDPVALGGSPPPSPMLNIYKDNRIPLSENYIERETERTQTQPMKYSDPDYYRYGIYDQNSNGKFRDQPQRHLYNEYTQPTESIVTITPTPTWVPIPLHHRVVKGSNRRKLVEDITSDNSNAAPSVAVTKTISSSYLNDSAHSAFSQHSCTTPEQCEKNAKRRKWYNLRRRRTQNTSVQANKDSSVGKGLIEIEKHSTSEKTVNVKKKGGVTSVAGASIPTARTSDQSDRHRSAMSITDSLYV